MKRLPLLIAAACAAHGAQAETSPYYVGASVAVTRDSNLLRLADGQATPAGLAKADTVTSLSLLAGIDQPFGRQRLSGSAALRDSRMANNKIYDNRGYSLAAALDWETVERVSGRLSVAADRVLRLQATGVGLATTERNLETTRQAEALVRVGVVTQWTAEASLGRRSLDYSATAFKLLAFDEDRWSVGLRWRPSSATSLGLAWRQAKGESPQAVPGIGGPPTADRYERRDIVLDGSIQPDAVHRFGATLGFGRKEHDQFTERDFSGVTGVASWLFRPTGKLKIETRLAREPGQDDRFTQQLAFGPNGFEVRTESLVFGRVNSSLRVRTDWEATAKIRVYGALAEIHRSVQERRSLGATTDGRDRATEIALGASWTPTRNATVGCDASHSRRRGDAVLTADSSGTTIGCYGQFVLQ